VGKFKLFLLALLVCLQLQAYAQELIPPTEGFSVGHEGLPATVAEAWDATVKIVNTAMFCNEENRRVDLRKWGTGVVVFYDQTNRLATVATNSHVMNSCKSGLVNFEVGFLKSGSLNSHETSSSVRILIDRPEIDLALFEVKVPKKILIQVAELAAPKTYEKVMALGYPDLSARKDWLKKPKNRDVIKRFSFGQTRTIQAVYPITATLNEKGGYTLGRGPVVFHTADILPGNSGGPLINEAGQVIGLNTKMIRVLDPKLKARQGTNNYFYCANEVPALTDCQNLAISSELILKELEFLHR
jgi:S1-C subfamily serine protease